MPLENLEKTRAMAQYFVFTEATNADRRSRSYLREKRDVLPTLRRVQQFSLVAIEECFAVCEIAKIAHLESRE